jgi:hypothetical protein
LVHVQETARQLEMVAIHTAGNQQQYGNDGKKISHRGI